MVVLAPWSSLTLPSGRAKPLVRGEGNPAACPQEESWGGQWPSGLLPGNLSPQLTMFIMALMERVVFFRGRLGIFLTGGGGGCVLSTSARMFSRTCRAAFDREE